MKRKLALLLAMVMLVTVLAACGNKNDDAAAPEETTVVEAEETTEDKENDSEEVVEETAEAVEVGEIAKLGLGSITSTTRSKDAADDKPASAQADVTVAAVAFDADGKIVSAKIDTQQTKVSFNEDASDAVIEDEYKTKKELEYDYDMLKASPIGKEWFEQIAAFEEYIVGMTADEVKAIPTKVLDDNHPTVPDVAELESSVTMDIGDYIIVVANAWENVVDAEGASKIGLGLEVSPSAKAKDGDKNASVQMNTYMNAIALDDEGKIVANIIDVVQPKVEADAEGKIVERSSEVLTKKMLEYDYDMLKASQIGKEWFEQMNAWEEFTIGKTIDEVLSIPVKERDPKHQHVPDLPELEASVTITVEGYQSVMEKAVNDAQ